MQGFTRIGLALLATAAVMALPRVGLAADYTLNINSALTTDDPLFKGLEAYKQKVEADTKGAVEVRLFPSSQLGKDEDVLEQARAGGNVAVVVDGGRLAVYTKEFGILGAPFLAQGYEGIRKVVTSDLFEGWVKQLHDDAGLQVLSFNWWQGQRNLLTNVPVKTPADLKGVRMRTPGAPVWMETIKAMGATPTPMGWTDVYPALQQHVIDGAEAQDPAVWGARLYEVIKYITKTGHINLITGVVTSAGWFDKLPADIQKILRDDALSAGDIASYGTKDSLANYEKMMTDKGVQIDEIDVTPFVKATAGVYDKLGYSDLRQQIEPILAK